METINNQNNQPKTTNTRKNSEPRKVVAVKSKKRKNASTVAIITLSILLGLSLLLGLTAAFFGANQSATGDITLGDPVNINITQGGTNVEAFTFAGTAMPGTTYSQPIGVSIPENSSECVLRCKLTLSNTGEATSFPVKATTSDTWSLNEDDDYYYYNGKAASGDSIDFCTQIEVPKELTNLDANKIYTITFQVEAIQYANGAASEVWTTAPSDWIESYGKGE
ncbi:MAG: hypothetical protein E7359_02295 [Clostridiales bacterium]|nr:hypothetical protein [Clostridiales bacterium]